MVVAYSWYISRQISGLRRLQTELTDHNRRESLQLLRIQNDLNQLGLAMCVIAPFCPMELQNSTVTTIQNTRERIA